MSTRWLRSTQSTPHRRPASSSPWRLEAVGGLPLADNLDIATVESLPRLQRNGGTGVVVPGAPVLDHRLITSLRSLHHPIDHADPAWRAAVERSGPALYRTARSVPVRGSDSPSRWQRRRRRWPSAGATGTWPGPGRALRRRVTRCGSRPSTGPTTSAAGAATCTSSLRGLAPVRRTPGSATSSGSSATPSRSRHAECDEADLVLVASHRFADAAARADDDARGGAPPGDGPPPVPPSARRPGHRHAVTVVAKTAGRSCGRSSPTPSRPASARRSTAAAGTASSTRSWWWRTTCPTRSCPSVYSSAGVVLNDHWGTMRPWGFVSNRLFDVLACGTPVISDPMPGIEELFAAPCASTAPRASCGTLVDEVLARPSRGPEARRAGSARAVLAAHTFDHRAEGARCWHRSWPAARRLVTAGRLSGRRPSSSSDVSQGVV